VSFLGVAESSLGDAKSSLGDAKSSLSDAKSSLGDAKSSLGDAKSSLSDAKSSLGDAKSSLGDGTDARVAKWVDVIVASYSEPATAKASAVLCVLREWVVVVRAMEKMVDSAPDLPQAQRGDLVEASKEGLTQRVEQLLDYGGADVHEVELGDKGYTALHHAACNGHLATAQALLQRGADIHAQDNVRIPVLRLPQRERERERERVGKSERECVRERRELQQDRHRDAEFKGRFVD
jgi:hypothetical protein